MRRAALSVFVVLAIMVMGIASFQATRASSKGDSLAILQGLTDDTTTQIAVLTLSTEVLSYQVSEVDRTSSVFSVRVERNLRSFSEWAVDQLLVEGLQPNTQYDLVVTDSAGKLRDHRQFQTLDTNKNTVRFAMASCVNDNYSATRTWAQLAKDRPDLLFMIGDNVYADHLGLVKRRTADPEQLWQRYAETWNNIPLFRFKQLIPTLATWDDHDYGANNGDRTYPHREESLETLMTFFAQDSRNSKVLSPGPGASSLYRAFGQNFMLLDNRSFRTEPGAGESTHWGRDQENWIVEQATAYPVPTWLFNGSQFFGAYHGKESVEGEHFESLERLRRSLKKLPQVFVFGSGDVHFSEVMQIEESFLGYESLELTSSSINGWFIKWMDRALSNPRRLHSHASHNYVLVSSTVVPRGLAIDAASRGADGEENFRILNQVLKP